MIEKIFKTKSGEIHYWTNKNNDENFANTLVFLPGLTADSRLFEKQIEYFKDSYKIFVWDPPAHRKSFPFELNFDLFDEARWLKEILSLENIKRPILIGQSMGGYVSQIYSLLFSDDIGGFISIDSAPLYRKYFKSYELFLLKSVRMIYSVFPWSLLLDMGPKGVAKTKYGQELMREMMKTYEGDKKRYVDLVSHGYKILSEAVKKDLEYSLSCEVLLICGEDDGFSFCTRSNKKWSEDFGHNLRWLKNSGHNSNTDSPEEVNKLIEEFLYKL